MTVQTPPRRFFSAALLLLSLLLAVTGPAVAEPGVAQTGKPATGNTLVTGIHPSPPFVIATDSGGWTGLSVELWRLMAEKAGLSYRFEPMELQTLFDALHNKRIELAVGALSMTAEREKNLDFSHPYIITGLGIATRVQTDGSLTTALGRLLSAELLQMLGVVVLWLLVSGALVWLFERRRNPAMFGGDPAEGIGSGFWWALVTLTTVGYGDKSPITPGGRMVAILWMVASLVILSSLTAAITSSLTVNSLTSTITGPEGLPGKRVATVTASASAQWLGQQGLSFHAYPKLSQALDALEARQADAVVYDAPILNYAIQQRPHADIRLLDHQFNLSFNAFALPQGSDKLETLNLAILEAIHGQRWQQLRADFLGSAN